MSAARWSTRPSRSRSSARRWPADRCSAPSILAIPALVAARPARRATSCWPNWSRARRTAAFAVADKAGAFDPAAVTVTADGDTLTGTVERVVDAGAADELLVAATRCRRGRRCTRSTPRARACSAPAGHPGPDPAAGHRSRFAGAPARLLAGPEEADRVIDPCAAGGFGAAGRRAGRRRHSICWTCPSTTRSRGCSSAGQIGSFQAIKHKLADLLVDLEHARSTAYHAVWALTDGSDDPALAVEHRPGDGVGGAQPDRGRHHPGARRYRVHLGTPGAPVLQARHHRRRAAGQCRAAPVAGRRTGAGQRRGRAGATGGRRYACLARATREVLCRFPFRRTRTPWRRRRSHRPAPSGRASPDGPFKSERAVVADVAARRHRLADAVQRRRRARVDVVADHVGHPPAPPDRRRP